MAHESHAHHGPDHVPHVSPLKVYFATWGALMVFTVITVGASYVDLGHTGNLILALLIALVKASLVAAFFMHLAHDHKFHTVILISGVAFFLVFVSFTMFDTTARGRVDPVEVNRTTNLADPFALPAAATASGAGSDPAPAPAAGEGEGEAPAPR